MLDQVTPLILTFNEEPNLGRTLSQLTWAREILVLDSGSTDRTLTLVRSFPNVRILHRTFDSFAQQCNFGLTQIETEWVLSLDADYVLTDELIQELQTLHPEPDTVGFSVAFRYCVFGRPLRGTLYPPRIVLYRRRMAAYGDDGHAHRVQVRGSVRPLGGRILHDDRKALTHWVWSQNRYAKLEAEKFATTPRAALGFNDRIRATIVLGPPVVLLYTLLVRGVILDGWAGWYYAFQRATAELILSMHLIEARLRKKGPSID